MIDFESVRFDFSSKVLYKILHDSSTRPDTSSKHVGIIYSDTPIPDMIKDKDFILKYEGKQITRNAEVYLLSVYPPASLDIFNISQFSEALSCIISFSFRRRFVASRWHCSILKDGRITEPMDLFTRQASAFAGPLHVHSISPDGLQYGTEVFYKLLESIRCLDLNDYYRVMRSFRMYLLALLTYPMDVGLAYSLLVSSVENLSSNLYDRDDLGLQPDDVLDGEWKRILKEHSADQALSKAIFEKLKKDIQWTKRKFIKFIEQYLPESFWTSFDSKAWEEDRWLESITPWKHSILDSYKKQYEKDGKKVIDPLRAFLSEEALKKLEENLKGTLKFSKQEKQAYDHVLRHWYLYRADRKLSREELHDTLERIYGKVRSGFLHRGESPPRSAIDRYETAPLEPRLKGNGKLVWERNIPSFYMFERIMHESILNYILTL